MDKFTQAYAKMLKGMNARKLISESLETPDAATEAVLKANGFTPGRKLYDFNESENGEVTGWTKPLQDGKSLFIGYDNAEECVYAYITDIIDANDENAEKQHKCLVGPRDYTGMFTSYEDAINELGSITGEDAWSVYDSDLTDWFQEDDDADWNLSQDDYDKAYQIFANMKAAMNSEAPAVESANDKNRKRRLIKESAENGFEDGLDAKLEAGGFYLDTANYVCYLPNESNYYIIVEKKVFQRWLSCNSSAWLRWSRPNLVSCR